MNMDEENKLLRFLSMALPYGVFCINSEDENSKAYKLKSINKHKGLWYYGFDGFSCLKPLPYLRPLSTMTEEEHSNLFNAYHYLEVKVAKSTGDYLKAAYIGDDAKYKWLLENKFDFLDLISDGLAIEITKENNPYKL